LTLTTCGPPQARSLGSYLDQNETPNTIIPNNDIALQHISGTLGVTVFLLKNNIKMWTGRMSVCFYGYL
jgi:hypothetical protein